MSKHPSRTIKAVLTLYEDANKGKTATLRYLYWLLTKSQPPKGFIDFREKFDYTASGKKCIIALSTFGDNEEEVELNWMFFRNKWKYAFKQLGLKVLRRPYEDNASEEGPVIVISATHVDDEGSRINDANIANLKKHLLHIQYVRKLHKKVLITSPIDSDTWEILINSPKPVGGWNDSRGRLAIHTAEILKEQIDNIVKHL